MCYSAAICALYIHTHPKKIWEVSSPPQSGLCERQSSEQSEKKLFFLMPTPRILQSDWLLAMLGWELFSKKNGFHALVLDMFESSLVYSEPVPK